jgi:hypothetical protein
LDDSVTVNVGFRLPAALRDQLQKLAAAENRSLNSLVVQTLSTAAWPPKRTDLGDLLHALELPSVLRLCSQSTSSDVTRLLEVSRLLGVERLLLAARANDLNGAVLTAVLETSSIALIMDSTWINMARRPRMLEVEDLMKGWDAMGLLEGSRYCTQLVPETRSLPPADAVRAMVEYGEPADLDLQRFLALLSGHGNFDVARFRAGDTGASA